VVFLTEILENETFLATLMFWVLFVCLIVCLFGCQSFGVVLKGSSPALAAA